MPAASLRWQGAPVGQWVSAPEGVLLAAYPRAVFEGMAEDILTPRFLQTALLGAGQPTNTSFLSQNLQTDIASAPDSLLLRLSGHEGSVAQAISEAIARQAQKVASKHVSGIPSKALELQNELAHANDNLDASQLRLGGFNRTNQVLDLEKEIGNVQQQRSDTALKIDILQTELQATEARMKALSDEVARQNPALNTAREALQDALSRYTDEHPKVRELRAAVAKLEAEVKAAPTNTLARMALSTNNPVLSLNLHIIEQRAIAEAARKQIEALGQVHTRLSRRLDFLAALRQSKTELESAVQKTQAEVAQLQKQLDQATAASNATPLYAIGSPRISIEPPPLSA